MIYVTCQRGGGGGGQFVIVKKQNDINFPCVCPVIYQEFRHNIVKVAVDPRGDI